MQAVLLISACINSLKLSFEGGARSLAMFDNDVGSSYASPVILTGGKDGDVGLHDFRYIATGRSKRLKNSDNSEQSPRATSATDKQAGSGAKVGVENFNGMLWYIPKAHLGNLRLKLVCT